MNWAIERDKEGKPIRMHWITSTDADRDAEQVEAERKLEAARNAPMPSMVEWARQHGLTK